MLLAAALTFFVFDFKPESQSDIQTKENETIILDSQTESAGDVQVSATPIINEYLKFEMVFDTHSGDLNYDLVSISQLKDKDENIYQPLAWEGDKPGGHHREGTLNFGPSSDISMLPVIILEINGIREENLIFKWDL